MTLCNLENKLKTNKNDDEARLRIAKAGLNSDLSKSIIFYLNLDTEIKSKKKIKREISASLIKKGRWRTPKQKIRIIDGEQTLFPPTGMILSENGIEISSPSYFLFIKSILAIRERVLSVIVAIESKLTLEFLYQGEWDIEEIEVPRNFFQTSAAFQTKKKNQLLRKEFENIFLLEDLPGELKKYLSVMENEYL